MKADPFCAHSSGACKPPAASLLSGKRDMRLLGAFFGKASRRGTMLIEAAMLIGITLPLLTGMVTLARTTYTYYTLRKTVYSIARYAGTQQGVNFCDASDPAVLAAVNFGMTGTTDASQPVLVTGLSADMFQITPEQFDPVAGTLSPCTCAPACDVSQGGTPPDFIAVSMPNGYKAPVRILGFNIEPILLKPQVKLPYGGT
jgi:hypothetical protein